MEVESKYIVRKSGAFSAMLALKALGRYRLEALPSEHVHDTYLDTEEGNLMSQGFVFRLREQGDDLLATLKSMDGAEGPLFKRLEIEATIHEALSEDGRVDLPDGPLKDSIDGLIGERALSSVLRLRQYRSPRAVFDGTRLVGVLSLDVLAVETEVGPDVSHQIEMELAEGGLDSDIYRMDPILKERGMEPAGMSKFERALILLQRNPASPLMLLPREQEALRRFQEVGTPLLRRRARVILLSTRGLTAPTVARKVGLSLLRVEHWLDAFRKQRMGIFDDSTVDRGVLRSQRRTKRFSITELISVGTRVPALFPSEVAVAQKWEEAYETYDLHSLETDDRYGVSVPSRIVREESVEASREAAGPISFMPMGDGSGGHPPNITKTEDALETTISAEAEIGDVAEEQLKLGSAASGGVPEASPRTSFPAAEPQSVHPDPSQPPVGGDAIAVGDDAELVGNDETGEVPVTPRSKEITLPNRPVLHSDEMVLSAAERVLRYQYAWHADAVGRVAQSDGEASSIRRLLIAQHRLRIALQLFEDYLPSKPVLRLHQELRGMVSSLDALGDLDHAIAHIESAQSDSLPESIAGLRPVLATLREERDAAWKTVQVRLDNASHTRWTNRFERLLDRLALQAEEVVEVDDFTPNEPDNYLDNVVDIPRRTRLQYMLGSAVWRRYESLRAFDSTIGEATDDLLHPLGVACAAMQYVLALTGGCTAESVRDVSRPMARLESHLSVLHLARLTEDTLGAYADMEDVAALRERLERVQTDVIADVDQLWNELITPAYRQALARVVASL